MLLKSLVTWLVLQSIMKIQMHEQFSMIPATLESQDMVDQLAAEGVPLHTHTHTRTQQRLTHFDFFHVHITFFLPLVTAYKSNEGNCCYMVT